MYVLLQNWQIVAVEKKLNKGEKNFRIRNKIIIIEKFYSVPTSYRTQMNIVLIQM